MFDVGSIGNIASILGLILAVVVALYQRDSALKAEREAKAEREKASTLEDHLLRQRWQQLRSLGEQIDQIELEKSQITEPTSAALHARLKEQYSSVLGVVTASTECFSVALIRRWVTTGRLFRTWQIEAALSFVSIDSTDKSSAEDERWLRTIIDSTNQSNQEGPKKVQLPKELNEFTAAYIIISSMNYEFIDSKLGYGQNNYTLSVLLGFLAQDCIEKHNVKLGKPNYKCWGSNDVEPFRSRYDYYQNMNFWMVCTLSSYFDSQLSCYDFYFENVGASPYHILPTSEAIKEAKELFPELCSSARGLLGVTK
ncbi:hypothetical protein Q8344_005256 [Vibrio harveyi]|nr:hypothetical protein [Vibrio harveyi]